MSGPSVCAATLNSRSASAAAALASDESAGCAGWIAAATSGRIVHASLWDSSKSTLMLAVGRFICRTVIPTAIHVNVDYHSTVRKNPAHGRH